MKLIFVRLLTDLFRKDLSSLLRINLQLISPRFVLYIPVSAMKGVYGYSKQGI